MKSNSKIYLWILPVAWMIVIFLFSNQPGSESSQLSGSFARLLESVVKNLNIAISPSQLHFLIRKTAHYTVFFILGLLLYIAIYPKKNPLFSTGLRSLIYGVAYAAFDEVHQLFIAGRAGQIRDVLIDSAGVLTAVALCSLAVAMRRGRLKQ